MTQTAVETKSEFQNLFEQRYNDLSIKEGDILEGTVVEIRRDAVLVNVGFKSEGAVPVEEFKNFDGELAIDVGDTTKVVVEQLEGNDGIIVLSKERADAMESWGRVSAVHDNDDVIEGVIVNKIKGGMSVNLGGIKAFLPASQIDLKPVKSLDKLIGVKCLFKILKLNQAKGNIVLSRRSVLEEERAVQKKALLKNIAEGQVLNGTVKNITDYGAFIDLGGIDGLLHITDLSWGRVNHPSEVLKVNQEIEVVILKYDEENEKVSLGYKQLKEDPWQNVDSRFTAGEKVSGKIVNITDYGVFVELGEGVEGLVHVSELSWNKKVKHPSKIVKEGDEIEAVILDLDPSNRRISLGVKQLEPNPWDGLKNRFPSGTKVKGQVRNITDFGLFIGVDGEEIDGLVHISDLTWDKGVTHPSELYKKGDEVDAVVLDVDIENERFALGIKQLSEDPMDKIRNGFAGGSRIKAKITQIESKGLELDVGVEDWKGFIAASDLSAHEKINPKDKFSEGEEIEALVRKIDEKEKTIILSIKAFEIKEEKTNIKAYKKPQSESQATLGDLMKTGSSEE